MLYFWWIFSSLAWSALTMLPDWVSVWARVCGQNVRPASYRYNQEVRKWWALGLAVIALCFFMAATGIYPGEE